MVLRILAYILVVASLLTVSLAAFAGKQVELTQGVDQSAGGGAAYVITTASAIWYLEKQGGGLSSMVDRDGIDWLGFHKEPGSGWKGEYRGFPNAIHRQDGNYFHAMNAGTDPSTSEVEIVADDHVRIAFTSGNAKWRGVWDFFPDRCDFTMVKVSEGYKYWVQYEGVPGGEMDATDFWYSSKDSRRRPIGGSCGVWWPGCACSPAWWSGSLSTRAGASSRRRRWSAGFCGRTRSGSWTPRAANTSQRIVGTYAKVPRSLSAR